MEEEVKENQEKKEINFKKYLPFAAIAVVAIIVIIALVSILGGGPKKAVKNFVNGMSSKNASKVVKSIDFAGESAWKYSYSVKDFSEDQYDEFIENYKDVDKDDIEDQKEATEKYLDKFFDNMKDTYKSYKMKVDTIKSVEKLGKDLYAVEAKISIKAKPEDKDENDEIDSSDVMTFVVYKNKVISSSLL